MSTNINTHRKLSRAWSCILTQYAKFLHTQYETHGPGMAIFVLRDRVTDGSNCEFNYAPKDSQLWSFLLEGCPNKEELSKKYIPDDHILVNINVEEGEELVSDVRILTLLSLEDVPYFKETQ